MKKIAIVALLSAFAAVPAVAADMYAAIDLGSVSYSNANGGPTGTTAFKNPGTIRIAGGSQINQNLGVEIGYSIIGESVIDTSIVIFDPFLGLASLSAKETLKTSSFQAVVVGTAPINDMLSIFGKLGLANTQIDYKLSSNFGLSASGSGSKSNLMFGIGGQYLMSKQLAIRAQYEDFGKITVGTVDIGVKAVSVGAVFGF